MGTSYVDPEPWVHQWPNDRSGDVRSAEEKCVVKDCVATYKPRSEAELQRIMENKSRPKHWWDKTVELVKKFWGNLIR